MTPEEYKLKLVEIQHQSKKQELNLMKEYALSNNPYKVGDVIKSNGITIKIEAGFHSLPACYYIGIPLKKDCTPYKNGIKQSIFQSNIK